MLREPRTACVFSACDGDEPALQINLYRWVAGLGLTPRVIGNVKGLQDPYRNPETQKGFAEKWGQNPAMVTSFADGSKISFEQAIVANATGFKVRVARHVARRRVRRRRRSSCPSLYDVDEVRELGGIVDYTVGPPDVKIFCLAEHADPKQRHYLELYKMGEGPLYPVLGPVPPPALRRAELDRAGRAVRRQRRPRRSAGPVVEVCAVAKRDLEAGETLDEYGMFMTYGEAVNTDEMSDAPATCPRGSSRAAACGRDDRQGRGAHLRRRRASARTARRPAPRRAVPPLPRRDVARGAAVSPLRTARRPA